MNDEQKIRFYEDQIVKLSKKIKELDDKIEEMNEINDQMLSIITKQSREIREYQNMERVKKIC